MGKTPAPSVVVVIHIACLYFYNELLHGLEKKGNGSLYTVVVSEITSGHSRPMAFLRFRDHAACFSRFLSRKATCWQRVSTLWKTATLLQVADAAHRTPSVNVETFHLDTQPPRFMMFTSGSPTIFNTWRQRRLKGLQHRRTALTAEHGLLRASRIKQRMVERFYYVNAGLYITHWANGLHRANTLILPFISSIAFQYFFRSTCPRSQKKLPDNAESRTVREGHGYAEPNIRNASLKIMLTSEKVCFCVRASQHLPRSRQI